MGNDNRALLREVLNSTASLAIIMGVFAYLIMNMMVEALPTRSQVDTVLVKLDQLLIHDRRVAQKRGGTSQ